MQRALPLFRNKGRSDDGGKGVERAAKAVAIAEAEDEDDEEEETACDVCAVPSRRRS